MYSDNGVDAIGKTADANIRSTSTAGSTCSVASAAATAKKGRRIPCPIDPSHEIYESRLEKHIKICPAARRKVNDASLPYYRDSVNCGGFGSLLSDEGEDVGDESQPPTKKTKSDEDTCTAVPISCSGTTRERAKELALRVLDAYDRLFLDGSNHDTKTLTSKLAPERIKYLKSLTFDQLIEGIPTHDLSQSEFDAGLQLSISSQKIKSGGQKHLRQIGSIVGHLRGMDLLPPLPLKQQQQGAKEEDNKRNDNQQQQVDTILEMGAGRGMTGLVAAGVLAASSGSAKLILVERSGTRGKAETTIRRAIDGRSGHDNNVDDRTYMHLAGLNMVRIKCDLAHVHLPTAMDIDNKGSSERSAKNVAVVAKHLCGAGTDLALKSLQPISHRIAGCVMATCCHGVCNWNDYVGRDYLRGVFNHTDGSFGKNEFDTLKYWGGMGSAPTVPEDMSSYIQKQQQGEKQEEEEDNHDNNLVYQVSRTEDRLSSVVRDLGLACGSKALGRACQRLIDYGRVEYMKNVLFKDADVDGTRMQHYINPDVTPQNVLLMSKCL